MSFNCHRITRRWRDHVPVVGLEGEPIRGLANAKRARMVSVVMKPAQEQKVVEAGFPTKRPMFVVMGFSAVRRHATSGKAAEAISHVERQA
jgi:hypothetical protein